jgi:hypothetical protein
MTANHHFAGAEIVEVQRLEARIDALAGLVDSECPE